MSKLSSSDGNRWSSTLIICMSTEMLWRPHPQPVRSAVLARNASFVSSCRGRSWATRS